MINCKANEGFVVCCCILFFRFEYVEMNVVILTIFTITEVLGKNALLFRSAVVEIQSAFIVGTCKGHGILQLLLEG